MYMGLSDTYGARLGVVRESSVCCSVSVIIVTSCMIVGCEVSLYSTALSATLRMCYDGQHTQESILISIFSAIMKVEVCPLVGIRFSSHY